MYYEWPSETMGSRSNHRHIPGTVRQWHLRGHERLVKDVEYRRSRDDRKGRVQARRIASYIEIQ